MGAEQREGQEGRKRGQEVGADRGRGGRGDNRWGRPGGWVGRENVGGEEWGQEGSQGRTPEEIDGEGGPGDNLEE